MYLSEITIAAALAGRPSGQVSLAAWPTWDVAVAFLATVLLSACRGGVLQADDVDEFRYQSRTTHGAALARLLCSLLRTCYGVRRVFDSPNRLVEHTHDVPWSKGLKGQRASLWHMPLYDRIS